MWILVSVRKRYADHQLTYERPGRGILCVSRPFRAPLQVKNDTFVILSSNAD